MNPVSSDSFEAGRSSPFDSRDCVDLLFDGPGDNTVRPIPPHLLPFALAEREKIARWQQLSAEDKPGEKGSEQQP